MSTRLDFSPAFSRKMAILSLMLAIAISIMTPVTYFMMSWNDCRREALLHAEAIVRNAQSTILENPDLWYYGLNKFIESTDDLQFYHNVQAIRVFDSRSSLKFEKVLATNSIFSYSFRAPIRSNNEVYGFIEITTSVEQLVIESLILLIVFIFLGISAGIYLYRFPVSLIKSAEKSVHEYTEEAKHLADEEINRLDRLRLVGQMAAGIGHEIRNPLTTVRGYLQFFSRKNDYSSSISQFQLMIDELDRANHIITEFLSLAHNKTVDKKNCNLNNIIDALLPLIQSDAMLYGISVETDLQDIPDTLLDDQEMRQLILNVTRNGLEAMQPGGCLSIVTAVEHNYVLLSIADQGSGIAPNLLPMIGTPFFTTKDHGTGLGLAVCYSIAYRHGGKINFSSDKTGTIFTIRLPRSS